MYTSRIGTRNSSFFGGTGGGSGSSHLPGAGKHSSRMLMQTARSRLPSHVFARSSPRPKGSLKVTPRIFLLFRYTKRLFARRFDSFLLCPARPDLLAKPSINRSVFLFCSAGKSRLSSQSVCSFLRESPSISKLPKKTDTYPLLKNLLSLGSRLRAKIMPGPVRLSMSLPSTERLQRALKPDRHDSAAKGSLRSSHEVRLAVPIWAWTSAASDSNCRLQACESALEPPWNLGCKIAFAGIQLTPASTSPSSGSGSEKSDSIDFRVLSARLGLAVKR